MKWFQLRRNRGEWNPFVKMVTKPQVPRQRTASSAIQIFTAGGRLCHGGG